ncbi:glycosyltransferase [Nitriliruptoraceae bacterium ZYF776]|nr:glycosyltransferase [Profundirhabdus halotolerans]
MRSTATCMPDSGGGTCPPTTTRGGRLASAEVVSGAPMAGTLVEGSVQVTSASNPHVPPVCVVVSTYDRSAVLPELVAALRAQDHTDFEAVLVDNGSHDDTLDHLQRLTADDPRFRVLRIEDNHGPGRARNVGWRSTASPLIAFTDDDCRPTPTWLTALLAAGRGADLVQGRTTRRPGAPREGWFDRGQNITAWTGRYETCNLLVPRAWLDRLGGFDESFPIAMGEDTDLGLRAEAAGATSAFAADALVHHHVWPNGFRDHLAQRRRRAEEVALVRVNPAARRNLTLRLAHGPTHLAIWAAVPLTVAAVRAGRPWIPVALVAAWVAQMTYRTRDTPWGVPARVGYNAADLAARCYETGCYLAVSVRERTLVL